MSSPVSLEKRIEILFETFNSKAASQSIPERGALSRQLQDLVNKARQKTQISISPNVSSLFATAAVESWQRAVHSFLVSASTTHVSPLWASVSGYYASHYSIRGMAHLLGFFQLYRARRILKIDIVGGKHLCQINKKDANDREHKVYWKIVKADDRFAEDPFFTPNDEDQNESDFSHRSLANYADHVNQFPKFDPLDKDALKLRVSKISTIRLSSVPIPNRLKYPDIENVQLIAYHRIVKFRSFLDQVLSNSNRFWNVHRTPSWCAGFINFQVVQPTFVSVYGND